MTQREAWKQVSEAFEGPVTPESEYGLCFAMARVLKVAYVPGLYSALKTWCGGTGWRATNSCLWYLAAPTTRNRPIRATIAALFAAMTDKERKEVLGV